jgi:hypothetical protein
MSRADASEAELNKLPNFYLYVDEFQSFANKSFADILSEARKYKLALTIAHQYIEQMEEEVRDAVFGNVGTMITFRVGAFDAEVLEKEFAPVFTAEDLVNLGFIQIYLKLMIDGISSQPFSATTMGPIKKPEISFREDVINSSHAQFARPRKDVEEIIAKFHEEGRAENPAPNRSGGNGNNNGGNGRGEYRGNGNGGDGRQNDRREQPQFPEKRFDTPKPVFVEVPESPVLPVQVENAPKEDPNKLAFLKVAEELKQKEQNKPIEVAAQPQAPITPKIQSVEPKVNHEKAKNPTPENISSLKSALSAVLAKTAPAQPAPSISPTPKPVEVSQRPQQVERVTQPEPPPRPQQKEVVVEQAKPKEYASVEGQNPAVKEVPEDVLRKLLSMDEVK